MRRLFWIALGAAIGVLVVRRVSRAAQAYTPEGIGRSLGSATEALRDLADTVREGMDQRERELRVALGVDAGTIDAGQAQELLEHPTAQHPTAQHQNR